MKKNNRNKNNNVYIYPRKKKVDNHDWTEKRNKLTEKWKFIEKKCVVLALFHAAIQIGNSFKSIPFTMGSRSKEKQVNANTNSNQCICVYVGLNILCIYNRNYLFGLHLICYLRNKQLKNKKLWRQKKNIQNALSHIFCFYIYVPKFFVCVSHEFASRRV